MTVEGYTLEYILRSRRPLKAQKPLLPNRLHLADKGAFVSNECRLSLGLRLDCDGLYFLLHGFDKLGQRLFGLEWQGDEAWARPLLPPAELAAGREVSERAIEAVIAQLGANRAARTRSVSSAEIDSLKAEETELYRKRAALYEILSDHPEPLESHQAEHARYHRFRAAEDALLTGLWEREIKAQFGPHQVIDWRIWSRNRDFKLIIDLSLAYAPRSLSSARRGTVFFERISFDKWLETVTPLVMAGQEPMTPEEHATRFLMEETKGRKRYSKPRYLELAVEQAPGLSQRAFNRVWDQVVPDLWRKGGRPKAQIN